MTEQEKRQLKEVKKAEETLEHKFMVALEYCGWLPENTKKEKKIKRGVQVCKPYCCFNHQVGLPRRVYRDPVTNEQVEGEEVELYPYEKAMVDNYEMYRYYAQNKVRGAGATEILAVRHMAYKYAVVNRIVGLKYLLAAGINQSIAVGIFRRMVRLLKPYVNIVFRLPPNIENPKTLMFRGGGEAYALASEPNAPRSFDKVGDVLLDEAAHWDLVDDEPVLKAYEPFVAKQGAKLGVFSTPGGQRGFFWTKIFDPECRPPTKYYKHVISFEEVANVPIPIIDVVEAERLRKEDGSTCTGVWQCLFTTR